MELMWDGVRNRKRHNLSSLLDFSLAATAALPYRAVRSRLRDHRLSNIITTHVPSPLLPHPPFHNWTLGYPVATTAKMGFAGEVFVGIGP